VVGIDCLPATQVGRVGARRPEGAGGDKAHHVYGFLVDAVENDSHQGRAPVALTESATSDLRPRGADGRPWRRASRDLAAERWEADFCLRMTEGMVFWYGFFSPLSSDVKCIAHLPSLLESVLRCTVMFGKTFNANASSVGVRPNHTQFC
jgi:hypothetical protein